jgi:hypothetical protein
LAFAFAVCAALVMVFELLAVPNSTAIVDVSDFGVVRALSAFGYYNGLCWTLTPTLDFSPDWF